MRGGRPRYLRDLHCPVVARYGSVQYGVAQIDAGRLGVARHGLVRRSMAWIGPVQFGPLLGSGENGPYGGALGNLAHPGRTAKNGPYGGALGNLAHPRRAHFGRIPKK